MNTLNTQQKFGWFFLPTYVGLALSLLLPASLIVGSSLVKPEMLQVEIFFWSLSLCLLALVLKWEQLPLSSLGFRKPKASDLLWGLVLGVCLFLLFPLLNALLSGLGLETSSGSKAAVLAKLPFYSLFFLALRAGITEELLYRSYPIERLVQLTGSKWIAALVPLAIFVVSHASWGLGHLVFVTAAGAVLTAFYMWKRSMWINMIGHFLVDFTLFMLIPVLMQKQ